MASNLLAMASNLLAMASTLLAMASTLLAMASNLLAMASTLIAMASDLIAPRPESSFVRSFNNLRGAGEHRRHFTLTIDGWKTRDDTSQASVERWELEGDIVKSLGTCLWSSISSLGVL